MYCTDLNALLHRGHVDEAEVGGVAQLGPVLLALHLALLHLNIFAFMLEIILILTFIKTIFTRLVIMTTTRTRCSHTRRQNSERVEGRGPWRWHSENPIIIASQFAAFIYQNKRVVV